MTDINKYIDSSNTIEILEKLKTISTLGEVKKLMDETFPTWFVTTMNSYCSDYPHLTENWKKICTMSGINPAQIMIVDDIIFGDSYTLIKTFCECFTRAGFSVRRKKEYIPCENCNCAVPTELMWVLFKEKGIKVPEKWNKKCTKC